MGFQLHVAANVGLGGPDDRDVPVLFQALLQALELDELWRAWVGGWLRGE